MDYLSLILTSIIALQESAEVKYHAYNKVLEDSITATFSTPFASFKQIVNACNDKSRELLEGHHH